MLKRARQHSSRQRNNQDKLNANVATRWSTLMRLKPDYSVGQHWAKMKTRTLKTRNELDDGGVVRG